MNTKILLSICIIILLLGGYGVVTRMIDTSTPSAKIPGIRYVALGDSYTIGLYIMADEAWPTLLTKQLQSEGIDIELIENLGVSGYTAADVISNELSQFENLAPDFATLLVGTNDISLGIDKETYRKNLVTILDRVQATLPNKSQFIVLTNPDFTKTPGGKQFFSEQEYTTGVKKYNEVIREEAQKRGITVVDLEDISGSLDRTYFTQDGIHPSGKQYQLWAQRIYPKAKALLDSSKE